MLADYALLTSPKYPCATSSGEIWKEGRNFRIYLIREYARYCP